MKKIILSLGGFLSFFSSLSGEHTFFVAHQQNRISATAECPSGFTLQNYETSCYYDSLASLQGEVALNGGTLELGRDLFSNSNLVCVSSGAIKGNGHVLSLPYSGKVLSFPRDTSGVTVLSEKTSNPFASGDRLEKLWSYNDSFIGFFSSLQSPAYLAPCDIVNEALIVSGEPLYTFLPGTSSIDWAEQTALIDWSPHYGIGALGFRDSNVPFKLLVADSDSSSTSAFRELDLSLPAGESIAVRRLFWSASGSELAVVMKTTTGFAVNVYKWLAQEKTLIKKGEALSLSPFDTTFDIGACCWDASGTRLFISGYSAATGKSLCCGVKYSEIAPTLTLAGTLVETGRISALVAHPQRKEGGALVGISRGDQYQQLVMYECTDGVLTSPVRYSFSYDVSDIAIHPNGCLVALSVLLPNGDNETVLSVLHEDTLTRCSAYRYQKPHGRLCWSSAEPHLVSSDGNECTVYFVQAGWFFSDLTLALHSSLKTDIPTTLYGSVLIEGDHHEFMNEGNLPFIVRADSSLMLRNIRLVCVRRSLIKNNGVFALDGASVIAPQGLKIKGSVSVAGSISFEGDIQFDSLELQQGTTVLLASGACMQGAILLPEGVSASISARDAAWTGTGVSCSLGKGSELCLDSVTWEWNGSTYVTGEGESALTIRNSTMSFDWSEEALAVPRVALKKSVIISEGISYYFVDALYEKTIAPSFSEWVKATGLRLPYEQNLQPVEYTVNTALYTLVHPLYLSAQSPLHITCDTVIKGNGGDIYCTEGMVNGIIIDPHVTSVRFADVRIHHFAPEQISKPDTCKLIWADNTVVECAAWGELRQTQYYETTRAGATVHFKGNGGTLVLAPGSGIVSNRDGSTCEFSRMTLALHERLGIVAGRGDRLVLTDMKLDLSADVLFSNGMLDIRGTNTISGGFTLDYASTQDSILHPGSRLIIRDNASLLFSSTMTLKGILGNAEIFLDSGHLATLPRVYPVISGISLRVGGICSCDMQGPGIQLLQMNGEGGCLVYEPYGKLHVRSSSQSNQNPTLSFQNG